MNDREHIQNDPSSMVDPDTLDVIDQIFVEAWKIVEGEKHVDHERQDHQRERLAKIVIDGRAEADEPIAQTARQAVDRFMAASVQKDS